MPGIIGSIRIKKKKWLRQEIIQMKEEHLSYQTLQQLQHEFMSLKTEVQNLKDGLNLTEDSDDSLPDSPINE